MIAVARCTPLLAALLLTSPLCGCTAGSVQAGDFTMASASATNLLSSQFWSEDRAQNLMYEVDSSLDDMLVFATNPNNGFTATPYASQTIAMASACSDGFASNGNTTLQGVLEYDGNSKPTRVALLMAFNDCTINGANNDTYMVSSVAVPIDGTVSCATDANGTTQHVFNLQSIAGKMDVTDSTASSDCMFSTTNTVTYTWSNTLQIQGGFSGTFCGQAQEGTFTNTLPVTLP